MTSLATLSNPIVTTRPRVLVVDDELTQHELIGDICGRDATCQVFSATTLAEARNLLASQPIELLVLDVNLPDGDGLSLLPVLSRYQPQACAIVITGQPTLDGAVSAIRRAR